MSYHSLLELTFTAQQGLSQYRAVDAGSAAFSAFYSDGSRFLGICQRDVSSGQSAPVLTFGASRVQVGGPVNARQFAQPQSGTGFMIVPTSGQADMTRIVGYFLTTAASGDVATMMIAPQFTIPLSGAAT